MQTKKVMPMFLVKNLVIAEGIQELEKDGKVEFQREIESKDVVFFNSTLERWICKKITGNDTFEIQTALFNLCPGQILDIEEYMMKELRGKSVETAVLDETFRQAVEKVELDVEKLQNLDEEDIKEINKTYMFGVKIRK